MALQDTALSWAWEGHYSLKDNYRINAKFRGVSIFRKNRLHGRHQIEGNETKLTCHGFQQIVK